MNNYEFLDLFLEEYDVYIWGLILSIVVYVMLFRHYVNSLFDPLLVSVIFSCFGTAVVFFLQFTGVMPVYTFLHYVLTQCAFFVGLWCFRASEVKSLISPRRTPKNFRQIKTCHVFFSIVSIICHLLTYTLRGIPLFMPSRLEAYIGGTGLGIISRFIDVSLLTSILCYYYLIANSKQTKVGLLHHLLFLTAIIFLILSGSKAAFLNVVFCLFCLFRFYPSLKESTKNVFPFSILRRKILLMVIGCLTAIFIISVQKYETPLNPLEELGLRFISSGDVYYMSYPNETYKLIDGSHGLEALFQDFLGFARIYSWDKLPLAIGLELIRYHHQGDVLWGPNARHNVFGLIYYGFWGGVLFSFLLGIVVSFFRNKMLTLAGNNIFHYLLYSLFYIKITIMETDPMLGFTYLNNVVFIFPVLFGLFLIFYQAIYPPDTTSVVRQNI